MEAKELFSEGKLAEALATATEDVRKHPADAERRAFLAVLLCFDGNLERADKQLDALVHHDPEAAVGISLTRQLVRAEQARQQFYKEGRVPEFLKTPDDRAALHLQASVMIREGKLEEASAALEQAEEMRGELKGTFNGESFADIRDLDDFTAGYFEVLTSTGKFYWIPMEDVIEMAIQPPQRARDLLWRQTTMIVRDGPEGEVYLPSIYAPVTEDLPVTARLGRATDWVGGEAAPVRGVGLRTFLVGDEARTIMETTDIAFGG
jgi:type VI secretion system protein ImpE